ncbi:hypothetical protein BDV96DRAFT_566637 [Lophiotrema nucula]|uniref:Uncharacterized protein n=1 Tax=Lophiotrema nucula TaxID=690887 RepID=A0A6A5ZPC7_9PLEO|nr:hypothetical protein BDV96DRAFT_566637 [Lophiotrema nucula]
MSAPKACSPPVTKACSLFASSKHLESIKLSQTATPPSTAPHNSLSRTHQLSTSLLSPSDSRLLLEAYNLDPPSTSSTASAILRDRILTLASELRFHLAASYQSLLSGSYQSLHSASYQNLHSASYQSLLAASYHQSLLSASYQSLHSASY